MDFRSTGNLRQQGVDTAANYSTCDQIIIVLRTAIRTLPTEIHYTNKNAQELKSLAIVCLKQVILS